MLLKETTLRSSASTNFTRKDVLSSNKLSKPKEVFTNEEIKLILIKNNKKRSKHGTGNYEKIKVVKTDERVDTNNSDNNVKGILKSQKNKSNSRLSLINEEISLKSVKFVDQDEDYGKRKKLVEVTIVPSYAMFYDNVIPPNDEENLPINKNSYNDKVYCKCQGCNIF
jgi:hypothetical protein